LAPPWFYPMSFCRQKSFLLFKYLKICPNPRCSCF
jgi:hypothetical protein